MNCAFILILESAAVSCPAAALPALFDPRSRRFPALPFVGKALKVELILDDFREEFRRRPNERVNVAGGWQFRTKLGFGPAIGAALGGPRTSELTKANALILMGVAYFQPITRGELSLLLGREVSRDAIAALRGEGFIATGPRSPTPAAPYAYVTTPGFLSRFGFETLRDLPDIEKLEDAGLLGREGKAAPRGDTLAAELKDVLGLGGDEAEREEARLTVSTGRRNGTVKPTGDESRSRARSARQTAISFGPNENSSVCSNCYDNGKIGQKSLF